MNNNNAFTSAFVNSGGGMNFGGPTAFGGSGAGNNNSAFTGSAFGNSNPGPSAFGGGAFNNNHNPGQTSSFNQGNNSHANSAFNNQSTFKNNNPPASGGGGHQVATFDASGNMINNPGSYRGGGGRGRGNSNRGGRGGGNRGGNMTYVAPGLSTGTHHSNNQPQTNPAYSTGASGDSGSIYPNQGANRGRGGGRGGRGGRGGGVPGQFKSLQWRPDGAQNQNQATSAQSMNATMSEDSSMNSAFNSGPTGFRQQQQNQLQQQQQNQLQQQQQQQQHGSSFSAFGGGQSQMNSGFKVNTRSAFGGGGGGSLATTTTPNGANGPVQSAFGGTSLTSASAETRAARGYSNPTVSNKSDSVFAVPASRQTPPSSNAQRFGAGANGSSAFSISQKSSLSTQSSTSRQKQSIESENPLENADSRMARFSAVPIGNRYDELKEKRVKERLDAIKSGAIPDPDKRSRLEDAITFVGTCKDMCPEFERHEREYQQNVEKFEKIPNTEHINHSRAVKAYARPAAGVEQALPSDVRPPDVLISTLDYLIKEIVNDNDLSDSHAFVRDRTRSIRQDFTLQNNRGSEAIYAHEIIARYHILCSHQLCENENFSEQQEMEQLRKVLTSLQEFYDDMRREGTPCPNEAEFRAYHILSHLHDPDMVRQAQLLPPHIFMDPYIQAAAEIHGITRRNNDVKRRAKIQSEASPNFFSRFFKMITGPRVSYLMACLLETNFGDIRKGALKAMNKSYMEQHEGFPVRDLVTILGFDNEIECIANCEEYDLALTHYGQASVVFGRKEQATRRRVFKEGTRAIRQHRNVRIVEAKRQNYSAAQIIYGEMPGPQQSNAMAIGSQPMAPSISSRQSIAQPPIQTKTGLTLTGKPTRFGPAVPVTTGAAAGTSALGPAILNTPSRVPSTFDFGLNGPSGQSTLAPAPSISIPVTGLATPSVSQVRTRQTPSQSSLSTSFPLASTTSGPPTSFPVSNPMQTSGFAVPSLPNPSMLDFKPSAPAGFAFNAPPSVSLDSSSINTTAPAVSSSQSSFAFKMPESVSTNSLSFGGANQVSRTTAPFAIAPSTQSVSGISIPKPKPSITTGYPPSSPGFYSSTPPPPSPVSAPPISDATRIVTRRGRIYPRSVVESFFKDFLERETDRIIRMTAAQVSQEAVVERSIRRARERQSTIRNQSELIMAEIISQVADEIAEDILADLYRETKLQRKVVTQWREFTRKCHQRAEELRRRQEHFLNNVRAMGSRAGLTDGNPMASKIQEYNAKQQRIRSGSASVSRTNGQSSMELVSNKRKRLLSIGQEGSPDSALVAGLKRVVEPKRELWAPLPVLKIVESRYHGAANIRSEQQQQDMLLTKTTGPALTKRRWRLFVNTPTFKEMHSKWLLTKLGVDMGRQTKAQQRSGTMIAVHQSKASDDKAMDMVVCGVEDQSVKDLLGMSKYAILETAAFMFEFSKIPFDGHEATENAIHQYWSAERGRLVKFLACFPKVKQPIVLILWTEAREMWERISPRMIEFLGLDQMVGSPSGPLLSYNFLNLSMTGMQLDPYVVGSLEWLASETRDFFEEPAVLLRGLLEKYRPIYEWALCRIALADGPFYSQFDEDDEEETYRWLVREHERKKMMTNGAGGLEKQTVPPRNLFVEATESGFNLAVSLFNMELESIAQTIEAKGQGETREGAEQEGKVKDAMARFIRRAELPAMKRGAIQERINFGMDPKSAFCDYMDVYIATLGGLAKEQQNLKAKTVMRTEIWELLTTSKEDRVPMEAAFKRISSQIMQWVETGILDTERFSVRMNKLDQQRLDLRWQQGQYQSNELAAYDVGEHEEDADRYHEAVPPSDIAFKPILIHDEVDVDGNVFDFEITVQSEVRAWEKQVEKQARDREERALAVPRDASSRASLTLPNGPLRFGDSRKRRAPEQPRVTMKKTRVENDEGAESNDDTNAEGDDDENLFLVQSSTPDATSVRSTPVQQLHDLLQAHTNNSSSTGKQIEQKIPASSFSWSAPAPLTGASTSQAEQPRSAFTSLPTTPASAAMSSNTTPPATPATGIDRLARLRNLIKEVKTTTLQQQ